MAEESAPARRNGITVIILVASVESQLEAEILGAGCEFSHLHGLPKALLPITGGKRVLDYWWEAIEGLRRINDAYLVTNALHFKHFERWATARGIPASHVINDGSTLRSNSLGAARDLALGLGRANWFSRAQKPDVMVIAGDSLFHREFDLHSIVNEKHLNEGFSLAISYRLGAGEDASARGVVEVDPRSRRVLRFVEKPTQGETESRLACPLFYILKPEIVECLPQYIARVATEREDFRPSLGRFMEWTVNESRQQVYSMRMPGVFRLIGDAGLKEYLDLVQHFQRVDSACAGAQGRGKLTVKAYARVGLFGNPSDGYNGATISLTIANFWASCSISQSDRLTLLPHPLFDPCDFGSLADLHFISRREGYQGGMRLLQAACKKFHEFCMDAGVSLPKRNFQLSYDTNIPRQVGLAGSSAIVTAAVKALMLFYDLDESHVREPMLPSLVLSVEQELGIAAGLQDRVVQAYEGLVFMDFAAEHFQRHGHGLYERLPAAQLQAALPLLWLVFCGEPSDSGAIHSDVKARHAARDPHVLQLMSEIAGVAHRAKAALREGDAAQCRGLMAENFALRRALFGDQVLGETNLRMMAIADKFGGVAKFPGSGGALVGTCDQQDLAHIRTAYEAESFVFTVIEPHWPQ